jgi:MFS family permease
MIAAAEPTAVHAPQDASLRAIPKYLWLVLISAFLGWMFDAADFQILTLVLTPSVGDLIGSADPRQIAPAGGLLMAIKLVAWGVGGITFGVVADRIGRSRTMVMTVLIYSTFTGLSGFAQNWLQLTILQAIAGIGIGGEWAAGAALVAETWPERWRARALQVMQSAFAFGFIAAALANLTLGPISWRLVFFAGAAPALVVFVVRRYVPEPQRWRNLQSFSHRPAQLRAIFTPDLRLSTAVGSLITAAMFLALFGATAWIPAWIPQLTDTTDAHSATVFASYAFLLANVGGLVGNLSLIWLADAIGRRLSYSLFAAGALLVSQALFRGVNDVQTLLLLMPIYGFLAIGGAGALAVYLPELFPTRIRATGQGFCWNFARLVTAAAPITTGTLVATTGSVPTAAATVSLIYLLGLVSIWLGPETRGLPLRDL